MTLIVGIKCSGGIVMGADGAATLGTVTGAQTVIQPTTKLRILQDRIIMGVSGPVGLGQLYCDQVGRLWKSGKLGRKTNLAEVQRLLHDAIGKDASRVLSDVRTISPVIGQQNAMQMCITHSLVAVPVGGHRGHPELIQCDILGNAEVASNDLPYVSVGIGQPLADPFLAFLRRVFWPNTLPNVADGILAVMWTLVHAIAVTPGGVAEPIQIATLSGGEEFKARELAKEEIEEHRQNVLGRRGTLRSFKMVPEVSPKSPPTYSP